jgi:hypothetical protein
VLFVFVALAKIRLPDESAVKLVFSTQFIPFHLSVEDVAVPEAIEPPEPAMSSPQENKPVAALYNSLSPAVLQVVKPAPDNLEIVVVPLRVAPLNSLIVLVAISPLILVVIKLVDVE